MSSNPTSTDATARVSITDLRCQVPDGVLAIGAEAPRLTWRVSATDHGLTQLAYRVDVAGQPDFSGATDSSGVVESAAQVGVASPGGALRSREVRYYRVRIQTAAGWSEWSPTLRVEAGLLAADDWSAIAVTLPDDPGATRQAPAPLLRHPFELSGVVVRARLYVTSLGVHRATLNGQPVTEDLFAPGWTPYDKRLLAETYDVTALLQDGSNVIAASLGDGWYRGRLGWGGDSRARYGDTLALLAQLEIEFADGTVDRVVSDGSWRASTGEIRSADFYDGDVVDLRERQPGWDQPGFDDSGWQPVEVVPLDLSLIEPRVAPPVRVIGVTSVEPTTGPGGSVRLDGGQNIAGWARIRVSGQAGDQVTVRFAEVLEPDGSLHTRSLRSAKATDVFTLADPAPTWLEPSFTFHGFRFAEVETSADVLAAEFVAISSDTPARGHFECSIAGLTRLHSNVAWSQRDNFVSVPTDCPQRDERLGWTGDAQAFAPTASTLFDAQSFWASWLVDLALEQDDELGVPSVVPDVVVTGEARYGRAGWADAATIVPWAVYESYGDPEILRRQYDSMRRWVDSLQARRGEDGLLIDGFQFGDWLDPDAPAEKPWEAKAEAGLLANAFFAYSARLAGDAAELLGDATAAAQRHALADEMARLTWSRWADHARTNQTGCAVVLALGIAPAEERADVAAALADLVRAADGQVATGFLGTPLILHALTDTGYPDEAYRMLLRTGVRSWLYQVEQDATTVWERWDAIRPDGSIHPGTMTVPDGVDPPDDGDAGAHMLSFNHYAYGAVIDWVYRHVAGIAPDREAPGYRHVLIAPKPVEGLAWAKGSVESAYGTISVSWQLEDGGPLKADISLPFGTTGTVHAPLTGASRLEVDGEVAAQDVVLGPGSHTLLITEPQVARHNMGR